MGQTRAVAIDETLAARVRADLAERGIEWEERRMFGSLIFMVGGSILVGVRGGGGLLARVDPAESTDLLADAGPLYAQVADMGGKDMGPSWLDVHPDAVADEAGLTHWVDAALRR